MLVQMVEKKMRRERVRIGEHDQDAVRRARGHLFEPVKDAVLLFLGIREHEGSHRDSGKRRRPLGDGRRVLDFARASDDTTCDAAEKRSTAEARVRAFDDGVELVLELRRYKEKCEIRNRALKRGKRCAECVLCRREAGAPRRDTGADAKVRAPRGHALSLSRSPRYAEGWFPVILASRHTGHRAALVLRPGI